MMIPTAMSTTLPLTAKALNSLITPIGYFLVTDEVGERSVNQQSGSCPKHLLTLLAPIDTSSSNKFTKCHYSRAINRSRPGFPEPFHYRLGTGFLFMFWSLGH
jgi:hypothetical protein